MNEATDLGPFTLDEPLGAGGMGMVWRATHRRSGKPIAIKFLISSGKSDQSLLAGFQREVQMVARLDHPNVVRVLDYGTVPDTLEQSSLHAGDPWLAMELATGGSLKESTVFGWTQLRWVLGSVLDGLAHAHARGVIHRDLKPGNILLTEQGDDRTLKLADFGIAHLRRAASRQRDIETGDSHSAGTPRFMAPEQLTGEFRDFGPWTDLYALGCIAFRLATGAHVFAGATIFELAHKHVHEAPPPVRARFPVPDGFESWVHRLLAKNPRERFQRAADAAWVLGEFPAPSSSLSPDDVEEFDELDDTVSDLGFVPEVAPRAATLTLDIDDTAPLEELIAATDPGIDGALELVAPVPASWRESHPPRADLRLFDAGLGLFGLRDTPVVGRLHHRDELWSALRAVRDDGAPRLVTIRGAAGSGKSRLARWIAERAHEVGGAAVLRVFHDREPTPGSGLLDALGRWTECEGLDRPGTWQRLRVLLTGRHRAPSDLAAALTELLLPAAGDDSDEVPRVRFSSPTERWTVYRDGLRALAGRRPIVLWVDDAQWGGRTLEGVDVLTRGPNAVAALVVMTVREEALDNRPGEAALLDGFGERCSTLHVEPLSGDERRDLVMAMLPLAPQAAMHIADRTEGYPLFVAQLLADWVERAVLVEGPRGFELADETATTLPDDIRALWRERLDALRVAFGGAPEAKRALEVAAALGRDIDDDEWWSACHALGFEPPAGLVAVMVQRGLATPRRNGWSFVHGLLTETVSDATDDPSTLHRACASVVAKQPAASGRDLRVARHLLAAGDAEAAVAPALAAIEEAWAADQFDAVNAMDVAERAVAQAELQAEDRRALSVRLWRVRKLRTEWKFDETTTLARELIDRAESAGLDGIRAEALVELGLALGYAGGDLPLALPDLRSAAALFEELGRDDQRAEVLTRISHIFTHTGEADASLEVAEEALAVFRSEDDPAGLARGLVAAAMARSAAGDVEGCVEAFEETVEVGRAAGLRYWEANALYGLANHDAGNGEYDRAIERYRQSARICEEIGSTAVDAARINLACVHILSDQWDEGRSILTEIESRGTLAQLMTRARVPLIVLAARVENWEAVSEHLDELEATPLKVDSTLQALIAMGLEQASDAPDELIARLEALT